MKQAELKELLDSTVERYNQPSFIEEDPICIPHQFSAKEDIEIAGFLTATIAWGKRDMIIRNAQSMIERMDGAPADFVRNHTTDDLQVFDGFVHRTFNSVDIKYFIQALQYIYLNFGGLETVLCSSDNLSDNIHNFKQQFFSLHHPERTTKHVADPLKGSSAKRICMFLRWMVRKDDNGVDFGIWNKLSPSQLKCPLDVHTGNVGRKLGLLKRKQNDWKAVEELSTALAKFDSNDPIKYDFALFGLGIYEGIK